MSDTTAFADLSALCLNRPGSDLEAAPDGLVPSPREYFHDQESDASDVPGLASSLAPHRRLGRRLGSQIMEQRVLGKAVSTIGEIIHVLTTPSLVLPGRLPGVPESRIQVGPSVRMRRTPPGSTGGKE